MPYYESVFIARQDITPAQVEAIVDSFEKVIVDGGGSVPKKESWGLKTLAYKIKKKPERSLHSDEYFCTSRSRARDGASNADQ